MKKLSVLVIATLVAMGSFAQNINVQTAFNHHKKGKLKEALEAIQPALEHSQTSMQPKTWYYYANICSAISQDATGAYNGLLANPLDEAARGYAKALELDKKEEYTDEITGRMRGIASLYSNKGVTAYEAKLYPEAAENFAKSYEVTEQLNQPNLSMLRYSGTCWLDAKNWDKAEVVYIKLKEANYNDASIYIGLAKIAVEKKELNKAVKYLDAIVNRDNPAKNVTGVVTLEIVLNERRKELFGEGHRSFDLLRNGMTIYRSDDEASRMFLPEHAKVIDWNNFRCILPIPVQELETNPSATSNPWGN
jgi:tetratricopeptide (TPR) repeat protein